MIALIALLCCLFFFGSHPTLAVTLVLAFFQSPLAPRHWLAGALPVATACVALALHMHALPVTDTRTYFAAQRNRSGWCRPQHVRVVESVARMHGTACTLDDFAPVHVPRHADLVRDDTQHARIFQDHGHAHAVATCAQAHVACFLWGVHDDTKNRTIALPGHALSALHVRHAEAVYAVPSPRVHDLLRPNPERQHLPGPFHLASAVALTVSPEGQVVFDDAFYSQIPHQWMVAYYLAVPARGGHPVQMTVHSSPVCVHLHECRHEPSVSEFFFALGRSATLPSHTLLAVLSPCAPGQPSCEWAGLLTHVVFQCANLLLLALLVRRMGALLQARVSVATVSACVLACLSLNWITLGAEMACARQPGKTCLAMLAGQVLQAVFAASIVWSSEFGATFFYMHKIPLSPVVCLFPWLALEGTVFFMNVVVVLVLSLGHVARACCVWFGDLRREQI
tara:strand:+ start:163 stop:1518 length:1356 start_codon:yes stop_codon:yes gene_type:complete